MYRWRWKYSNKPSGITHIDKLRLPIKIFVLNNNGYGIIKQFQELYLDGRFEASGKGVTNPNFKKFQKLLT